MSIKRPPLAIKEVEPLMITVAELAMLARINENMVYDAIRRGELAYFPAGTDKRIPLDEARAWISRRCRRETV